ncbi:MAG TPA: alanine--tRNA ligase [Aquirhabdus sp.]
MTVKPQSRTVADIREDFLRFFESKGHTRVASSSLIPTNDPTLLFTNAGMNQFKDTFLGLDPRDYVRATSSQKCVRAGGKHNDLDNVGYTARHHTFFEMLGNFSFGDYFKKDAIAFAWEFLTSPSWMNIPKDRLYVTIYATDDEAFGFWNKDIGLDASRIIRIGDKGAAFASDNFWAMGDTGPCGPCTEIFYDHGAEIAGGLPGTPEEDGDRFIEIWNCVFMQFNRQKDGSMQALPAPSVDTGMGLERISAVMQHVHANYEIDLFAHLIQSACKIIGIEDEGQPSLRVVADHARSCSFLIADGVNPSNEGRGYVLRRIIRRAVRHGNKLGATGAFFYQMVQPLIDVMGEAYPELVARREAIENALRKEEEQFARTLEQGLKLLEAELPNVQGNVIHGEVAFKLYDTYGFPVDLTADIARERGLTVDQAGFEVAMDEQRRRARDSGKFTVDYNSFVKVDSTTQFDGYKATTGSGQIIALYKDGQPADSLSEGEEGFIVLNQTPFYAESGGQIGDTGILTGLDGIFEVQDTKKSGNAIVHQGVVTMGKIQSNQTVEAEVKQNLRAAIARNHSATHLLHAALRKVLGEHVSQKGSLVSADLLRFDFSHDHAVTVDQINEVERLVAQEIISNSAVETEEMSMANAKTKGAMMLFGEKYGDEVRVLAMGNKTHEQYFSVELCGGIHVERTGEIGLLKIISEGGIAAGVRRIEAVTGLNALNFIQTGERQLAQIAGLTKTARGKTFEKVQALSERNRDLEKHIDSLNQKLANAESIELVTQARWVGGSQLLVATLENIESKHLRTLLDSVKSRLPESVIVLASTDGDKINLLASVSTSQTSKIKAGEIISHLSGLLGGKGGGKPDFAQGGAPISDEFAQIMQDIPAWIETKLA